MGRLRTLHAYLTRQVLASLILTVAVFTFVLMLGNVLREVLALLVNRQATLGNVLEAIGLLVPWVWAFALPMGMLTATLLIFGRFSADQELTAVRASGISLVALSSPVILLSLALCAISAVVNMEVAPKSRVAYTLLIDRLKMELASAQFPEGVFIKEFKGYIFYVGKKRGQILQDVIVFQLHQQSTNTSEPYALALRAPRGLIEFDYPNKRANLTLYDAKSIYEGSPATADLSLALDLAPQKQNSPAAKISDMTFSQLRELQRELEQLLRAGSKPLTNLTPVEVAARKKEFQKRRDDLTAPVLFQIHRQVAFSFACFGFTLVGIPLGVRVHRRETNIGIAIALLLVAVYYGFVMLAGALQTRPEFAPHLIVWLPNFVFQSIGAVLLWRANRGAV
jgi:lipopolysaccharide export system permease protein